MKISFIVLFLLSFKTFSQIRIDTITAIPKEELKFKFKQLIIPITFISYGIIGLESGQIKGFNSGIKTEVAEHIDQKISVDDFMQYMPIASLYGLPAVGIKSKNSVKDKTIILATSYLLMGLTVNMFKKTARVERPDGTSFNSFPSGHTATAFMGAELMYQEYKDISIWYGISGYAIAASTGAFRMYNNRHWLSDVLAGAGIGILSAKAGYWLYPITNKWFTNKNSRDSRTTLIPFYDGQNTGFGFIKSF